MTLSLKTLVLVCKTIGGAAIAVPSNIFADGCGLQNTQSKSHFKGGKNIMIKVTIGNNVKRTSEILDENTTLREALEEAEVDYTRGIMNLDGSTLSPGDLDRTFADFGITEKCYLLNVVKADNAV